MIRFRSLRTLIIAALILMAAIPMALIITVSHRNSIAEAQHGAGNVLSTLASDALDVIYRNLFERIGDVQAFASSPDATGMKPDQLTSAANHFTTLYGLYDLMLICAVDGKVVAANRIDFNGKPVPGTHALVGVSLAGEPWFASILKQDPRKIETDYSNLEYSERVRNTCGGDGLALRFSAPIFRDGKIVGVWTNYASWDRIVRAAIRQLLDPASPADGKLAKVGFAGCEIQLLDRDGAVLYDGAGLGAGPTKDYAPETNLVAFGLEAADAVRTAAKTGKDAQGVTSETHKRTGQEMVNGWAWRSGALGFSFDRYNWGLLVRAPLDQALIPARHLLLLQLSIALAALVASVFVAAHIANGIVRPIRQVESVMAALAGGDLSRTVSVDSANEIGRLAGSVNTTIEQLRTMVGNIDQGSASLAAAAEELSATATQLVSSAAESDAQANSVSAASEEVSSSIGSVASSAEEMASSVKEISGNTAEASQIAREAASQADQSNALVQRLASASQAIGSVVQTISGIAGQTNLLALNATIEAAHAGDAGRGFAVVASEVKTLAGQTATATKDIGSRITTIQADVQSTVDALRAIGVTTQRIDKTQGTIASAVEEQAATTDEMTRNLAQAHQGAAEISKQIQGVAASAKVVSQGAADTQRAAEELSRLSNSLRALISKMRV